MFRVALKGLLAHKVRVLMTALSIALGVAFVAGTFVLTDSMNSSFSSGFTAQYAGVDVDVRSPAAISDDEVGGGRRPLPESVLQAVRAVPGVARAEGAVSGTAVLVGRDGRTVGRGALATVGSSAPTATGEVSYRRGRAPANGDEIAIDARSARSAGYAPGDRVRVLLQGPPREFTVVGTARFGGQDSLGATTAVLFDTATAQQVLGRPAQFDEVRVLAAKGVSAAQLRDRVRAALPAGTDVTTGSAVAAELTTQVKANLSFVNVFLLVFAAIAVFVGSFIIWNTFSILVAQRARELALLRAIGASRRQVLRSVLAEAVAVGLLASTLGIVIGVGTARVLSVLLRQTGIDMPAPGAHVSLRTALVSYAVGTVVTLLASLAPARRATRVAPVEALRESAPAGYRFTRGRAVAGTLLLAAGLAALAGGLWGGSGASVVGLGVLGTFLGTTVLLPLLARVLARVLGAPLARLGMTGALARDNAMRNPKRTASTAAALMIGLALVATVSVLASSLKTSIGSDIDRTARAELVVQQVGGNGAGISPDAAGAVRRVPGVAAASEVSAGQAEFDGATAAVSPVDPATIDAVLDLGVRSGSTSGLVGDSVLVYADVAKAKGWSVGSPVPVRWSETGAATLRVAGTYTEKGAFDSDYLVSLPTFDRNVTGRMDQMVLVKTAPGSAAARVQADVVTALRPYANAEVLTRAEFKASISGQVDSFLLFVTALLLLAVFIALMGIVTTLALSVFERTREIGLLRAVGMTRRQVRAMVRYESVIISLIGALTGAGIGVGFGVALVDALHDQGVSHLTLPGQRIAVYVVAAAAAGVLAAVLPARRAADVDVLRAVVSD